MKRGLLFLCLFTSYWCAAQQSAGEKAIMKPIDLLFRAMHRGDSAMARKAFTANATITTVWTDKEGQTIVRSGNFLKYMDAIGTPHPEAWSELVWDVDIRASDNLATAWMNYAFYVGRELSHCGVDAFQLVRDAAGEWRIFSVADTRKTSGCEIPPEIQKQLPEKE